MTPNLIRKYTKMKFAIADKDKSGAIDLREFIPLFHEFIKENKISLSSDLYSAIEAEKNYSLDDIENNNINPYSFYFFFIKYLFYFF